MAATRNGLDANDLGVHADSAFGAAARSRFLSMAFSVMAVPHTLLLISG